MPLLPPIRLTGAHVLHDGAMHDASLTLADGVIQDTPATDLDMRGYLVLPGIIDLHGDGFERHLSPRRTAPFEKRRALRSVAAELAANGVTTAWLAQSWSWEGGFRSAEATEALLVAVKAMRPELLPDVRVQIRLETHMIDDRQRVLDAVAGFGVDYIVFNNHLDEALEMAEQHPKRFAGWASQQFDDPSILLHIVERAKELDDVVPKALATLSAALSSRGVALGSHDDTDADKRQFFRGIHALICEFPTTREAASEARAHNEPVLMGAPNVVRGGSQSGNIAAENLIADGLCTALVSDYYYPALSQAAFALADWGTLPFAQAWDLVSGAPARAMGLADRGSLEAGKRADLVIVDPQTHAIEATITGGRLAYAHGAVARRLMGGAVLAAQ